MHRDIDNQLHKQTRILRSRRLMYAGVQLIPVHDGTGLSDNWHLPGGEIASTHDLIRRAKRRDVNITVIE